MGTASVEEIKEVETEEEATELEFLTWFAQNADFGPGDGDVQVHMRQLFEAKTGKLVPKNWQYE